MADVQRTGRVGGHEFHLHLATAADADAAERVTGGEHAADDFATGLGPEEQVDEAGTGDLGALDPGRVRQLFDHALREFAGIALQPAGELHRDVAGVVAVARPAWGVREGCRRRDWRLRLALEALGPIFVKFGQVLSTRRDLRAARHRRRTGALQDRVPPFSTSEALATLERAYGKPVDEVFLRFEREAVASASVAQVHFAVLPDGREVAVKILRPGIGGDRARLALLETAAGRDRGAVGRRPPAEAARSGRRVRQAPGRRARPDARGRERQPAAAQLPRLADLLRVPEVTGTGARPT
jgi:hypothetical protein